MDRITRAWKARHAPEAAARSWPLIFGVLVVGLSVGCDESPTALDGTTLVDANVASDAATAASAHDGSHAVFPTWHQGFNHGTEGWFGNGTTGPLGWCGDITQIERRGADLTPSAGRGFATVSVGSCNTFWGDLGVPLGAPWAPGPDLSLFSTAWPPSGFVTELDVYLDPDWSSEFAGGNLPPFPNDAIVDFSASIRELTGDPPSAFDTFRYYFVPVEAVSGQTALEIFGRRVTQAGWYTFRYVFRDDGGQVEVDFELKQRRGGTVFVEQDLQAYTLAGPFKVPFAGDLPTSEYGSGYIWFFDIAAGLELPIDEHTVRPGR